MTYTPEDFNIEPSMIDLFRKDTQDQLALIKDILVLLKQSDHLRQKNYQELQNCFRKIRATAAILHFKKLMALIHAAIDFIDGFLKNKAQILEVDFTPILSSIDWIKECVKKNNTEMVVLANQGDKAVNDLIDRLTTSLLTKTSETPSPKTSFQPLNQTLTGDLESKDLKMMDLFKDELENQLKLLSDGILELERSSVIPPDVTSLLRAAHSLKGAAKVVNLQLLSELAHQLEDYFIGVQKGIISIKSTQIDQILVIIDYLLEIVTLPSNDIVKWLDERMSKTERYIALLKNISKDDPVSKEASFLDTASSNIPVKSVEETHERVLRVTAQSLKRMKNPAGELFNEVPKERVLRVSAQNLNRLMGLAGESLVESRWLFPFSESLFRVKKAFNEVSHLVDELNLDLLDNKLSSNRLRNTQLLKDKCSLCQDTINDRLAELDSFINRNTSISDRLYQEVIESRMRAFADGVEQFPRMVRDLARGLGKKVRLEIIGRETPIDRDILEKLIAPIGHLLRNAVDHGIELPADRVAAGKPEEGVITLQAEHKGGMISITLKDDGAGLDLGKIRDCVIKRRLATPEVALNLNQNELIDFIFLPGFSSAENVTDISGRGIGLHIVQEMVNEVSGQLSVSTEPGKGTFFSLRLPLTLSVIHSLIVSIQDEPYAFPLGRIDRALMVHKKDVRKVGNRSYFVFEDKNVGMVYAKDLIFSHSSSVIEDDHEVIEYPVVIMSDNQNSYGLIVDLFIGEKELVVQELDPRLGKVPNISSGAFFEDGSPLLIFDVEDLIGSLDQMLSRSDYADFKTQTKDERSIVNKRILIVDDSSTIRELSSQLLVEEGFEVLAVKNGRDAWNALRLDRYDLVVTDIDMPRMNGFQLIQAIRSDQKLKSIPVIIISYKNRLEDREQGLKAGANEYLIKGSYSKEDLVKRVNELT